MISTTPSGSYWYQALPGCTPIGSLTSVGFIQDRSFLIAYFASPVDRREVGQPCLDRRAAEVLGQRRGEVVLPLGDHADQRVELLQPPLDRPGAAAAERCAQLRDGVRDAAGTPVRDAETVMSVPSLRRGRDVAAMARPYGTNTRGTRRNRARPLTPCTPAGPAARGARSAVPVPVHRPPDTRVGARGAVDRVAPRRPSSHAAAAVQPGGGGRGHRTRPRVRRPRRRARQRVRWPG